MAKKSMLLSTCDSCGKEKNHPLPRLKSSEWTLPKGWVHVRADESKTTIFALDLCDECFAPIRDLAGKHRRSRKAAEDMSQPVASSTSTDYHGEQEKPEAAPKASKKAAKESKEEVTVEDSKSEDSEQQEQEEGEPVAVGA